jgi:hypothetical protein
MKEPYCLAVLKRGEVQTCPKSNGRSLYSRYVDYSASRRSTGTYAVSLFRDRRRTKRECPSVSALAAPHRSVAQTRQRKDGSGKIPISARPQTPARHTASVISRAGAIAERAGRVECDSRQIRQTAAVSRARAKGG